MTTTRMSGSGCPAESVTFPSREISLTADLAERSISSPSASGKMKFPHDTAVSSISNIIGIRNAFLPIRRIDAESG